MDHQLKVWGGGERMEGERTASVIWGYEGLIDPATCGIEVAVVV